MSLADNPGSITKKNTDTITINISMDESGKYKAVFLCNISKKIAVEINLGQTEPDNIPISGEKHNLLINICKKYNASKYLSGKGALQYMDDAYLSELENNNVEHEIIESHLASEYPYSALYYILKEGKDKVNEILGNAKLSKQSTPVLYN